MASLQLRPTTLGHPAGGSAKLTKSRGRIVVKPLLKRLHSHSDRASLDLDRGWDDQPSLDQHQHHHYHHGPYDAPPVSPHYSPYASSSVARSPRDVAFSLSPSDFGTAVAFTAGGAPGGGPGSVPAGPAKPHSFSHARSASAASHASIATSNSGAGRNGGSFVHPFQQTPQTSLSYAHSRASLDIGARDCSPTITEDDGDFDPHDSFHSVATPPARPPQPRRSSLASQPASSLSDAHQNLHVVASRSLSGSVQRLASSSANQSRSELQMSAGASLVDSPLSTTAPPATAVCSPQFATAPPSCSSSTAPMSPLRSSLDLGGFRLRSRSEVDAVTRQDHVREARRKFEAKERAKEERYAREQVRKRERACSKETQKQERQQARMRKASHTSLSSRPPSGPRPRMTADGVGLGLVEADEKTACSGRADEAPSSGQVPGSKTGSAKRTSSNRTKMAKQKTVSVWTAFVLWLRTRLLKLGRR